MAFTPSTSTVIPSLTLPTTPAPKPATTPVKPNTGTALTATQSGAPLGRTTGAAPTSGVFTPNPALSAVFSQPKPTTVTAPAVSTSTAAENHVADMKNTANQAVNDTTLHQANVAATGAGASTNTQSQTMQNPDGTTTLTTPSGAKITVDSTGKVTAQVDAQGNPIQSGTDSTGGNMEDLVNKILGTGGAGDVGAAADSAQNEITGQQNQISADEQAIADLYDPNNPNGIPATTDAMTQMANGTYPLTAPQQAQVTGVQGQYAGAIAQATELAKNIQGGAEAMNAQTGLQMYSPSTAASNINAAVQKGQAAISKLNSSMLNAQAKLTAALEKGDYKDAAAYMTSLDKAQTARTTEINDLTKSIDSEQKNMTTGLKDYVNSMISAGKADATSMNNANNLAYKYNALDEKTYNDNQKLIKSAQVKQTASEKTAAALANFAQTFAPGFTFPSGQFQGQTSIDDNGYIKPDIWKAAIADAPAEGMTRSDFIKQFGSQLYAPGGKIDSKYGLTGAEGKLVTGTLTAAGQ